MPKIDPIWTKISPNLGVGSANEWGCSKATEMNTVLTMEATIMK
jgi:hypothetical protein